MRIDLVDVAVEIVEEDGGWGVDERCAGQAT
jgi:hypothetical protein